MALIFTGEKLENLLLQTEGTAQRAVVANIDAFLDTRPMGTVRILQGLRRTGKTFAMLQAIANLPPEKRARSAFIVAGNEDHTGKIIKKMIDMVMDKYKYFFVDEITQSKALPSNIANFANTVGSMGCNVVLSGTDSLAFTLADSQMLGRKRTFKTTRIPFLEQKDIMPGLSFSEYAKVGGMLSSESFLAAQVPDNPEFSEIHRTYTFSSIAENISRSLAASEKLWPSRLADLCKERDMVQLINFCAFHDTHKLMMREINKRFVSNEAKILSRLMNAAYNGDVLRAIGGENLPKPKELNEKYRKALSLMLPDERSIKLDKDILYEAEGLFLDIGMIEQCDARLSQDKDQIREGRLNFLAQPALRWAQVQTLVNIASKISGIDKNLIDRRIISEMGLQIHGKCFEEAAFLEIQDACLSPGYRGRSIETFEDDFVRVFKCIGDATHPEIDVVVALPHTTGFAAYEIKRHEIPHESDAKNLKNKKFIEELEYYFGPCLDLAVLCPCGEDTGIHRDIDTFFIEKLPTLVEELKDRAGDSPGPRP